jgi:hypothetical protein
MYKNTNVCPTIGRYCSLHRVDGSCAYPGGSCLDVVEQCGDCFLIVNNKCKIYPSPANVWKKPKGCPRRRKISHYERAKFYGTHIAKEKRLREEPASTKKDAEKETKTNSEESKKSSEKRGLGRIRKFGINLRERLKF